MGQMATTSDNIPMLLTSTIHNSAAVSMLIIIDY